MLIRRRDVSPSLSTGSPERHAAAEERDRTRDPLGDQPSYHLRRNAADQYSGLYIPGHDGSCRNYRLLSNGHAAQDDCTSPDPDAIADANIFMKRQPRFLCSLIEPLDDEVVGRCFEAYPGTDHAPIADLDP
jgi:hypothetical protein